MKVEDLRIGNICSVDGNESRIIHIQEHYQWVQLEGNMLLTNINLVNPVPINEEKLITFGFKGPSDYLEINDCVINLNYKEMWISFGGLGKDCQEVKFKMPEYLHTLQNLYFALTGHELEIK